MIEREINLLAPSIIKLRSWRIYWERLGHLLRFIIFLSGVLLLVIAGAYLVVWWTEQSLTNTTELGSAQSAAAVAEVRRVNAQLAAVQAWQATNNPWTARLPAIFAVMPAGIELSYVGVKGDTQALELRGIFARRDALVSFQRQLEALPWVEAVEAPLSNFETGSDAEFQLRIVRVPVKSPH
jgi:hypothetical protein